MKKKLSAIKNPKVIKGIITITVCLLVIAGYMFYQNTRDRVFIDDSLLSAPIITISPASAGKVTEIDVYEGEMVRKGDPLGIVAGSTLHADTNGLVISAPNLAGSTVTPQTQLIQLIQPGSLRVAGTIDENKGLNQIHVGQVVSFTVDAFPGKTYWGYVDEISPSAKTTQLAFSISSERPTQQFVIYARFNYVKYPQLKNGMSAKMVVYTATQ